MKFSGMVGYAIPTETEASVWADVVVEKPHKGDIKRNSRRWESTEDLNDDLRITNKIDIIANGFATTNMHYMKYVVLNGGRWKVIKVDINRPRIEITLGGVYNGNTPTT